MRRSIVVIDDDEIYKIIIGKMISNSGLFDREYLFTDSREALEFCLNEAVKPDVILLDLNMPHLDGWEFLDKIKDSCPHTYCQTEIYIVTSSIFAKDQERAKTYEGVKGFISKPITKELLEKIAFGNSIDPEN
ncbi:response regulator [Salinimicrobium soli]|uniref:response regulator n=1 Tax=Salinimicrobium soli TaxID=1254399 RepID=UPI003AAB088A